MAKRKGMSVEEKRRVVLSIYHTTKDVFNLKEIEALASKQGVVQQRYGNTSARPRRILIV